MGRRRPLGTGHHQRRRTGHPRRGDHDLEELATAIGEVGRTDKPFGVNFVLIAADVGDRVDLMIRERVKVASFAMAPKPELITRLKQAGALVIPSIGAAKHARRLLHGASMR